MGYLHIENLYKCRDVLLFRECYALEKIHGTSANLKWLGGNVLYSSGGEKRDNFVKLFDDGKLVASFLAIGHPEVTVYGEAYGGKQQGQSWRYGKSLRFVAFEVRVGETWLSVENAADVTAKLGLEFVHYRRISTDLAAVDAERDAPSEQAKRNGVEGDQPREGIVLRPLEEMTKSNGARIIAKHKRDEERETATSRTVDAEKLEVLRAANDIAVEWRGEIRTVTPCRTPGTRNHRPSPTEKPTSQHGFGDRRRKIGVLNRRQAFCALIPAITKRRYKVTFQVDDT